MPKNKISLTKITLSAVDLINEKPFGELGLAALAEKLEIKVPSLYNHISGLEEIYSSVSLYCFSTLIEVLKTSAIGKQGISALLSLSGSYRQFAKDNYGIYKLSFNTLETQEIKDEKAKLYNLLKLILQPLNLDPKSEISVIRAVRSFIHGFVDIEMSEGFKMDYDVDKSFDQSVETIIRALIAN